MSAAGLLTEIVTAGGRILDPWKPKVAAPKPLAPAVREHLGELRDALRTGQTVLDLVGIFGDCEVWIAPWSPDPAPGPAAPEAAHWRQIAKGEWAPSFEYDQRRFQLKKIVDRGKCRYCGAKGPTGIYLAEKTLAFPTCCRHSWRMACWKTKKGR